MSFMFSPFSTSPAEPAQLRPQEATRHVGCGPRHRTEMGDADLRGRGDSSSVPMADSWGSRAGHWLVQHHRLLLGSEGWAV